MEIQDGIGHTFLASSFSHQTSLCVARVQHGEKDSIRMLNMDDNFLVFAWGNSSGGSGYKQFCFSHRAHCNWHVFKRNVGGNAFLQQFLNMNSPTARDFITAAQSIDRATLEQHAAVAPLREMGDRTGYNNLLTVHDNILTSQHNNTN